MYKIQKHPPVSRSLSFKTTTPNGNQHDKNSTQHLPKHAYAPAQWLYRTRRTNWYNAQWVSVTQIDWSKATQLSCCNARRTNSGISTERLV